MLKCLIWGNGRIFHQYINIIISIYLAPSRTLVINVQKNQPYSKHQKLIVYNFSKKLRILVVYPVYIK